MGELVDPTDLLNFINKEFECSIDNFKLRNLYNEGG